MLQKNIKNRTIFCKDNLDLLRGMNTETIDLVYLDPPFNKNKTQFTAPIGTSAEENFLLVLKIFLKTNLILLLKAFTSAPKNLFSASCLIPASIWLYMIIKNDALKLAPSALVPIGAVKVLFLLKGGSR